MTHGRLTEGSLRAHDRKGREGKGSRKGRDGIYQSTLHGIATSVAREFRPDAMQEASR